MSPLRPLIKLLILPVDEEYRRTALVLDHANRRIDRLEKDRDRNGSSTDLREYTKLLHHLCHNLVVELSKLKIEEETLKTKTRVMEKDFEFLGKREKSPGKRSLQMKIAFVVQRYGLEINGGAELHCRWVAEHLKKYAEVEVLTTKAADYITWKDHYRRDEEVVNGIRVRRFPVTRVREPGALRPRPGIVSSAGSTREADELKWLDEEGPRVPGLIDYLREPRGAYDYFIFFSYRYYHSYWGIKAVPGRSILVPTAERDPVIASLDLPGPFPDPTRDRL